MTETKILIPDPAVLITGLRDTGYDFNTSLSDIVDNSIDAKSTVIDVGIELRSNGKPVVTVADNGCGMDRSSLIDGMRYGAKDTTNKDPKRLGKFGLGLKTASTAFCRKLSVISKANKEDDFIMATWNLDHVARNNEWQLELLEEVDIPSSYQPFLTRIKKLAIDGHGTIVIWDEIDRMSAGVVSKKTVDAYEESFNRYATMIFHRFLDENDSRAPNIRMKLNGKRLIPFDPFCKRELRDDDTGTILLAKDDKECEMLMPDGSIRSATFSLKGYVLPYKDDFSSEASLKDARINNKNMGFWVYRENRMIAAGDWLGTRVPEPHDSLCRIEFSFDH